MRLKNQLRNKNENSLDNTLEGQRLCVKSNGGKKERKYEGIKIKKGDRQK